MKISNMCKYCNTPMAEKYGDEIESIESRDASAHIQQTPDSNFLFVVGENVFYHFKINYCPMYGRNLSHKQNNNNLPTSKKINKRWDIANKIKIN